MPSSLNLTPDHRIAGVLIPVFALRSEADQGIGDTGDLRQFIVWAAGAGFSLVQLLPINETGGDNSPYNAISSMALDPATLELTPSVLEDLSEEDYRAVLATADLSAMRVGPVQYAKVKALKRALLSRAYRRFDGGQGTASVARREAFEKFRQENAVWLHPYAIFRALMDENGGTECWDLWPEEQRTAARAVAWVENLPEDQRETFAGKAEFYAYVQWVAYRQWEGIKKFAQEHGVGLMGDIPLGVSYYSADFFGNAEIFEPGWSGGAPPEPYFKDDPFTQKWGQNWGIPVYNWAEMAKNDYAWWRQRVRGVRDLFHVFRIDHILGFYRIYSFPWRPEQNLSFLPLSAQEALGNARAGVCRSSSPGPTRPTNKKPPTAATAKSFLRMVLEAAGDTRLIGEDLGTVPDYVRPSLTELGIAGFKIPIWEPDHHTGGLLAGSDYARLSLATFGTHDHEPLRALWDRWQQAPPEERAELHKLAQFAGIPEGDAGGRVHRSRPRPTAHRAFPVQQLDRRVHDHGPPRARRTLQRARHLRRLQLEPPHAPDGGNALRRPRTSPTRRPLAR